MKIGAYDPANDSSTKPWFISSVVVTVGLIILLSGNLIFSFNVLDSFRDQELGAERASWKLLLYAEQMHMATRASALSGNLKWKETYDEARPKLETVLNEVPDYVASPDIRQKAEKLQDTYNSIKEIEARTYELVSRGDKDEALTILSGWSYTKNRLMFERTAREIVNTIQQRIRQRAAVQKRLALFFLVFVLAAFMYLIVSWTITIRLWRNQIRSKQQAEANVRRSEEKYRKLINTSPDSIAFIDNRGYVITSNPAMASQLETDPGTLEGKRLDHVMDGEAAEFHMEKGLEAIQQEEVVSAEDNRNGKIFENYYVPVYTADGRGAFQTISKDITAQKKMEEKLTEMSHNDALTSLYARSFFEEEMRRLEDGRHLPQGIIMCDVDGLKLINDAMGHDVGDALLLAAADVLRSTFRKSDVIARIGGDEFVVLLPNTDEGTVRERCRIIQQEVDRHNRDESHETLSVSLGYAVATSPPVDMDELFKEADNNMYDNKLRERSEARRRILETITKRMEKSDYLHLGHVENLQQYSRALGEAAGLSEERLDELDLLSRYHDLGKVGIPEDILHKPGPLSEEERQVMKTHCEIGYRIASSISELSHIADYILKHHEWWNGNGYPMGLAGEDIPLESRIISITDAFDAMTTPRHSGEVKSYQEALEELQRCARHQFDPNLVEKFLQLDFFQ